MNDERPAQQLKLIKIYLKDASLETPNSPMIFNEQRQPSITVQLTSASSRVAEDIHEVVLTLTVTAAIEEQTVYLVEIQQAGVFAITGLPTEQLEPVLGIFCPNTLFPFAREALASLIGKGGFPPLLLDPINFEAIYMQRKQQMQPSPQAQPFNTEH